MPNSSAFSAPIAAVEPVDLARANLLLARWQHNLGPVHRPFRSEAWTLNVLGEPVAVAVTTSTVSEHVTGADHGQPVSLQRSEVVELARLCSDPAQRWATRPMLRLWRETCATRWQCWPVAAAVAYSQNRRHAGDIYRWDGWTLINSDCGSSGGGSWSRKRYATEAVHGRKTLWLWRYLAVTP